MEVTLEYYWKNDVDTMPQLTILFSLWQKCVDYDCPHNASLIIQNLNKIMKAPADIWITEKNASWNLIWIEYLFHRLIWLLRWP